MTATTSLALVRLPGRLVNIAERHRHPYRAAVLVQMAVAVEILLMTGLRINNLANLDIERHLVRPSRRKPDLHIVIAGEEVKNREPLEYPLPAESAALVQRYLEEFRPRLARDGSTALFPGRGRCAESAQCAASSRLSASSSSTPACASTRTCSGISVRSRSSTLIPASTKSPAACSHIARSRRRPPSTPDARRPPPSGITTRPF